MPSKSGLHSLINLGIEQNSSPFNTIQKKTFNVILVMILCFGLLSLVTNVLELSWTLYDTVLYSSFSLIMLATFGLLTTGRFKSSVILFISLTVILMFVLTLISQKAYLSSLSSLITIMIIIIVLRAPRLHILLGVILFLQQITLLWILSLDYSFGSSLYSGSDINYTPLTRCIVFSCFYWFVFSLTFGLKRQITISASQLKLKNDEIQNSYVEMEKFGHVISHDLKSPIRNMTNFAGLISRKLKSGEIEKAEEFATIIQDTGGKALNLIDDVLTFSKLKNDDQQELKSSIGLDALLIDVENDLLPLYPESVVKFNQLGEITGNYSKLKILFQNLIENGLKYNQSHNPIIRISRYKNKVEDYIKIEDNGIGIDEKHYALIFEPFKRLHSDSAYPGSGIGLASCKSIVNEHLGGSLTVSSAPNEGSVFTIQLPLA